MPRPSITRLRRPRTWGSHTMPWENVSIPAIVYYPSMAVSGVMKSRYGSAVVWLFVFCIFWVKTTFIISGLLTGICWLGIRECRVRYRTRRAGGAATGRKDRIELLEFMDNITGQWPEVCEEFGLTRRSNKQAPKLRDPEFTLGGSVKATVITAEVLKPEAEFIRRASEFASVFRCDGGVRVEPLRRGEISMVFHRLDAMSRPLPLAELPSAPTGRLAYGIQENRNVASILLHLSLLVVGQTGSGKSSLMQALIADLLRQKQEVWLYISDTKRQEWRKYAKNVGVRQGTLTVKEYTQEPDESEEMIKRWLKNMGTRQRNTEDRDWKPFDRENPLCLFIADEFMDLLDTVKLGAKSPLAGGLRKGRSTGYAAWLGTQMAQKSVVGDLRDLVPQRVAMRTQDEIGTRMALGIGEAGGAFSHDISPDQPGVGYAFVDGGNRAQKVRIALVEDDDLDQISQGLLPPELVRATHLATGTGAAAHYTYQLYDDKGVFLYAGETNAACINEVGDINFNNRRFKEHAATQPWWDEVDHSRTIVEEHRSRKIALEVEQNLIKRGVEGVRPLYNKEYNKDNPNRVQRFAKRIDARTKGAFSSPNDFLTQEQINAKRARAEQDQDVDA